jgi:phosphatidylglycerophosphate synthase
MDPFHPTIRGNLTPYFLEVRSKDTAREATRKLIKSQQKKVLDLPAEYIHPPIENALTLFLLNTPVTPNMVTLFSVVVGISVAYLFWHGYIIPGVVGAFIVGILDGVDGKLARTKLHFTRFGRHEALIDYFNENSWYIALAVGLGATASVPHLPAFIAALLVVSDMTDNIFYTLAGKWFGKSIDLFSPFDAAFRRIAGRRNIYTLMFTIGFLLGFPLYTFAAVAVWAAVTAGIHGIRLIRFGRHFKKSPGYQIK